MPSSASPVKHHPLPQLDLPPAAPSPATTSPPTPAPTPPPSPPAPPPPPLSPLAANPALPVNLITDVCGFKLCRVCASSTPHIAHADFAAIIVFQRLRPDVFHAAPLGKNAVVIPQNDFSLLPETAYAPGFPPTPLPISTRELFIRAAVQMNTFNALLNGAHRSEFELILHAVRLKFAVQMGELTTITATETDSEDDDKPDDQTTVVQLSANDVESAQPERPTLHRERVEPTDPPPPVRPRAPPPAFALIESLVDVVPDANDESEQPTIITNFMGDVLFRLIPTSKAWIRVSDFAAVLEMQHRHPQFFANAPTKGVFCAGMRLGRWAKLENPLGMAVQINAFNAILDSQLGDEFEYVLEATRMQIMWSSRPPAPDEPCCEDPECSGVAESAASSPTSSFYSGDSD